MFTGLIDDVGTIDDVRTTNDGRQLSIQCHYPDLAEGESVAVNGACLTALRAGAGRLTVAAAAMTLSRTTIGEWERGRRVNLERAMRADARFGGHIVQGHVDGVARVRSLRQDGDARLVDLALPSGLADLTVLHGSIAVDGVSLTVNALPADGVVQIALIEYTLTHTALGELRLDQSVHIETDVIGKYVKQMMRKT